MPEVYNWQLGRQMYYPYAGRHPRWQFAFVFNINRCIACQTCTMACKSTWTFSKGQEYMWWNNVETKPYGGYPRSWDVKLLRLLDDAHRESGQEASWDPAPRDDDQRPYGVFEGMTIFEAAHRAPKREEVALGYEPADRERSVPNFYEDTAAGSRDQRSRLNLESTALPTHQTWFFYLQRLCNHCTYPARLAACPRGTGPSRPREGHPCQHLLRRPPPPGATCGTAGPGPRSCRRGLRDRRWTSRR